MDDLAARVSRGLGLYRALLRALSTPEKGWELEVDGVRYPTVRTVEHNGVLFEARVGSLPTVAVVRLLFEGEVVLSTPAGRPCDYDGVLSWFLEAEGSPALAA